MAVHADRNSLDILEMYSRLSSPFVLSNLNIFLGLGSSIFESRYKYLWGGELVIVYSSSNSFAVRILRLF
jgi:hypothetical protein